MWSSTRCSVCSLLSSSFRTNKIFPLLFSTFQDAEWGGQTMKQRSEERKKEWKRLVKLRKNPSTRRESRSVLLTDPKVIHELLKKERGDLFRSVYLHPKSTFSLPKIPSPHFFSVTHVFKQKIEKINRTKGKTHCIAEVKLPNHILFGAHYGDEEEETQRPNNNPHDKLEFEKWRKFKRVLILDGVSDPGNVGSLLRSAWFLGWEAIITIRDSCDPLNEKSLRASSGAPFSVPLAIGMEWEEVFSLLCPEMQSPVDLLVSQAALPTSFSGNSSICCWTSKPDERAMKVDLGEKNRRALLLGHETRGVQSDVMGWKGGRVMGVCVVGTGNCDSLNVAAAGSILLWNLLKGSLNPICFS